MFDVLSDEYRQMDELSGKKEHFIEKAVSLEDPVSQLMDEEFSVISEDTSLSEVIRILQDKHLAAVVLEKEGKMTGIFTERDILTKVVGYRLDLDKEPVSKYMTADPDALHPEDSLAFALNKMTSGGFRHIPIIDESNKVLSVISMLAIINHLGHYYFDEVMNLPPKPVRRQEQAEGG